MMTSTIKRRRRTRITTLFTGNIPPSTVNISISKLDVEYLNIALYKCTGIRADISFQVAFSY